jgi:hypothetical protein
MRYMIGSELGWVSVPFILLIGAAYVWVAGRLGRKVDVRTSEQAPSVRKAA